MVPGTCASRALTVAFWLKLRGAQSDGYGGIVSTLNYAGSKWTEGFDAYYTSKMLFKVREWPDKEYEIGKSPLPAYDTWNYLTWVWKGESPDVFLKYYENGIKMDGALDFRNRQLLVNPPRRVMIGRLFYNQDLHYGNFELDNLVILDEALSDEDVLDIYVAEQ